MTQDWKNRLSTDKCRKGATKRMVGRTDTVRTKWTNGTVQGMEGHHGHRGRKGADPTPGTQGGDPALLRRIL